MKKVMNWRGCLCVFLLLSLVFTAVDAVYAQNMNSGLIIPDSEIQQVKEAALQGSKEAAKRLVNHYEFGVEDRKQALHWARIAAENGDAVAEFNYGTLLRLTGDPMSQTRAKFWYRRAKQSGLKYISPMDNKFMESK